MAHALGYLRALVALVIGVGVSVAGWAQAPAAPAVRFSVFSAKPVADVAYVPRANANPQKLQFQPTARSARYEYRGAMPLRFFDATSGAVVAEANIPAGMRDALLLFTPIEGSAPALATAPKAGTSTLRYQVAVMDDSVAQLAPGALAIVNLSGLTLSGTVNTEKVTLKAGLNPPLAVGGAAKIAFNTTFKNRVYQSYAGTATLRRNERALLILFPPFYAGSLEVQSRLLLDQPPGTAAGVSPVAPKAGTPKR